MWDFEMTSFRVGFSLKKFHCILTANFEALKMDVVIWIAEKIHQACEVATKQKEDAYELTRSKISELTPVCCQQKGWVKC